MLKKITSTQHALSTLNELGLDGGEFFYRGQANIDWKLQPSIYRYCDFLRYQTVIHENFLFDDKPYEPLPPLTITDYDLEWLMTCQHYGVPTRLLDWTNSFLIALFFSCFDKSNFDKDGVLFICNKNDYKHLKDFASFNQLSKDKGEIIFMDTNLSNPRMRSQSGCFLLWDNFPLNEETHKESYDLWEYHQDNSNDFFVKKNHDT